MALNERAAAREKEAEVAQEEMTRMKREHARTVSVSSTKSCTGHMLGAAGAVEFIACTMAVGEGQVPPTINHHTPDPELDLDYTPNQSRTRDVEVALSNSFGFGGHNVTLAVRRYRE